MDRNTSSLFIDLENNNGCFSDKGGFPVLICTLQVFGGRIVSEFVCVCVCVCMCVCVCVCVWRAGGIHGIVKVKIGAVTYHCLLTACIQIQISTIYNSLYKHSVRSRQNANTTICAHTQDCISSPTSGLGVVHVHLRCKQSL